MFMSFIAGLVFGVGSGMFEKTIAGQLRNKLELSHSEISILSFAGLMLLASIIVSAMNFDSSAFWLVLGGAIGAFAIRGFLFGQSKLEERKQAAQETVSDLTDDAHNVAEEAVEAAKDVAGDVKDAAKKVAEPA